MRSFIPVFVILAVAGCSDSGNGNGNGGACGDLVIFHTNDRHSHFHSILNYDDVNYDGQGTVGGALRWMSLVEAERAANDNVMLVDAGDFTMGTMLVAAQNTAADLNMMKKLGTTAAALGNHEFDWRPHRLAAMINAGDAPVIPLLATNIEFDGAAALETLYGSKIVASLVHQTCPDDADSGVKVGLIGLMGEEAAGVSNAAPTVTFPDADDTAALVQPIVDQLRSEADLVVALAHMGVHGDYEGTDPGDSIKLAKQVEGIDIIISGHSHTDLTQDIDVTCEVAGSTWVTSILEADNYGKHLGRYDIKFDDQKQVTSIEGKAIPINDSVDEWPDGEAWIAELVTDVEANFLPQFPQQPAAEAFLTGEYLQVLTHSDFELKRRGDETSNLGNLLADAAWELCGTDLVAMSHGGDLREDLRPAQGGEISLADAFIAAPLGIGPDGLVGYPLVKFHLRLVEIQMMLEATICDLGQEDSDYMLSFAGLRVEYDPTKSPCVQKMTQYVNVDESDTGTVLFDVANGGFQVDEFNTFPSICLSSYIASFLGNFSVQPKDETGTVIPVDFADEASLEQIIVYDDGDREMKVWYVLAKKLASFGAKIPLQYADDGNPLGDYWRRSRDMKLHP